ncbi:MAG: Kelch repeat-containing protein [Polyangiales bacterium]
MKQTLSVVGLLCLVGCSSRHEEAAGDASVRPTRTESEVRALVRTFVPRGFRRPSAHLDVRLPEHAAAPMHVAWGDAAIDVVAEEIAAVPLSKAGVAMDVAHETDAVHVRSDSVVEELRVLHDPTAPNHFVWTLRPSPAIAGFRVRDARVEALDGEGRVLLATDPIVAVDASKTSRTLGVSIERAGDVWKLRASIDTRGLAFPVIVDPAWRKPTAAWGHEKNDGYAAARLGGDVFLVTGGGTHLATTAKVSRYEAAVDKWTTVGSLATGRYQHAAQPIDATHVMVIGGQDQVGNALSSTEIYDAATSGWTAGAPLSIVRDTPVTGALSDGRILVVGGHQGGTTLSNAEIYDPTAKSWSSAGNVGFTVTSDQGDAGAMVALASGGAVVVDGPSGKISVFDGATKTWKVASTQHLGTGFAKLAPMGSKVLAYNTDETYEYDPVADSYGPKITSVLSYPSMGVTLSSGKVLAIDGIGIAAALYTSGSGWANTTNDLSSHTDKAPLFALASGAVLVLEPAHEIFEDLVNGTACTSDGQCDSGHCVDGVCCDAACDASCQACDVPGKVGTCTTITGKPHGTRAACGGSCSDLCNGTSIICAAGTASTPCGTPSCAGGVISGTGTCSGPGSTCAIAPVDCAGHLTCADGTSCKTTCASDGDCASGYGCNTVSKSCVAKSDAGADATEDASSDSGSSVPADFDAGPGGAVKVGDFKKCTTAADCGGGVCAGGYCCDRDCNETCMSCFLPQFPGKCSPVPVGFDPAGSCNKGGSCLETCDGAGKCRTAFTGAQCAPNKCSGPTSGVGSAFCPAVGAACPASAAVPFECAPFVCEPAFGACRTTCNSSADCASGFACENHDCVVAQPPPDSGGCAMGKPTDARGLLALGALLGALGVMRRRRN